MSEIPTLKNIVEKELRSMWGIMSGIAVIAAITGLNILNTPPIYTIILVGIIIISFVIHVMYKVSITLAENKPKPKDPRPEHVDKNLEYKDVEFAIYYLTKIIDQEKFLVPEHLFNWNEIPGDEKENKLRTFLTLLAPSLKDVEVPWMENAEFKKIDKDKTIEISSGQNKCLITLYDNDEKAILTGPEEHGFKNYEFIAKRKNGTHTISQKYSPKKNIVIGVDRGGAVIGGMLAKNLGLAIKTLATAYANPPKRKPGVVTSIRSEKRKCLDNITFKDIKRILLVDDAIRGGGSMKAAKAMVDEKLIFCWDEIPGNDDDRLKEILMQNFDLDWAKTARIEKIDNGKTIKVSMKKNSLTLRFNKEETKVNLDIDNRENYEFIVKEMDCKRYICFDIEVKIVCILNRVGGRRDTNPDFWVYEAETDILLPWDKMHWFEELVLEKDEINLFNKIYDESRKKIRRKIESKTNESS